MSHTPVETAEPDRSRMFRPPVNRAMRTLDRAFFAKDIPLSAARIGNIQLISKLRSALLKTEDLLQVDRISSVQLEQGVQPASQARKCLLLRPGIKYNDPMSWTPPLQDLVKQDEGTIIPFKLSLEYTYWDYHDIMSAILPEEQQEEMPTGFSIVGHIAHLNLRDQYIPYKSLVAEVLMDKNPGIRTVINKIDEVGEVSEYRTFSYELLAGDPDMNVEVKEEECRFHFDYSKVYWNSRLNTEHRRLVDKFRPGETVCDVMAGVGPFAVPAGKKGVFVWANDLNPDCFSSLQDAIESNKVVFYVRAFNQDGHKFIRNATNQLIDMTESGRATVTRPPMPVRGHGKDRDRFQAPESIVIPATFDHFVMNLPAIAIDFLDSFIGVYKGHEKLFSPYTQRALPLIHVHCFSTKSDDNSAEKIKICNEISRKVEHEITPETPDVEIWDVRDVAPQKRMFCATFRLPKEVAFR